MRSTLPSGQTVELKPGGYHVMFVGWKAPLKGGRALPLKLKFEKAGEVTVDVTIDAARRGDGASGTMQH
jgi:copper(I)-binding protein